MNFSLKHLFRKEEPFGSIPRFSGTAIYGYPAYITTMTRNDKMGEGFVAKTLIICSGIASTKAACSFTINIHG
jgi:hypothetical protein